MKFGKTSLFSTLLALALSFPALAETIQLSDRAADDKAYIPSTLVSLLTDSGLKLKKANDGVYVLNAANLRCDLRSNMALDSENPQAYISQVECRLNSEKYQTPAPGQRMRESHAIFDLFGSKLDLVDCGMGRCDLFVKSINCSVDTNIPETRGAGRFTCTVTY